MNLESKLSEFVARATARLGEKLDAIVLYGSAARDEFDEGHSDLNLLVLTHRMDVEVMRRAAPLLVWWVEAGHPQPLLFTRAEWLQSADAFPIEIVDMKASHRVLHGPDPVGELVVNPAVLRLQLEHEARSKLLRLRQKAMPQLGSPQTLLRLMTDSVSTFILLLRHILALKGHPIGLRRRELLALAGSSGFFQPDSFIQLVDLREGKLSPKAVDSVQLFEDYLRQIQILVASIDAH